MWRCLSMSVCVLCWAACDRGAGDDSGGAGAPPADTFVTSPCGVCSLAACSGEVDVCSADAACAAYLECVQACPIDVLGAADAGCEAECPEPPSADSRDRVAALSICRLDGPGSECPDCGVVSLLTQRCPSAATEPVPWTRCEKEKCCETLQACDDDAGCAALVACIQACPVGDTACEDQCVRDHEGGMEKLGAHLVCIYAECSAEFDVPACVACVSESCPNTHAACSSNADCFLMEGCVGRCSGNAACIDDCLAASPSAAQLFAALGVCSIQYCATQCQ